MIPESGAKHFRILGICEEIRKVAEELVRHYRKLDVSEEKTCALRLALDEAVSNAVKHGHYDNRAREIRIDCEWTPQEIRLIVADEGEGFEREHVPDPTTRDNLQKESGRGLYIISSIMSEVSFNEAGNEIRMTLKREGECC